MVFLFKFKCNGSSWRNMGILYFNWQATPSSPILISLVTLAVNKHEYDWKKVNCFILFKSFPYSLCIFWWKNEEEENINFLKKEQELYQINPEQGLLKIGPKFLGSFLETTRAWSGGVLESASKKIRFIFSHSWLDQTYQFTSYFLYILFEPFNAVQIYLKKCSKIQASEWTIVMHTFIFALFFPFLEH